MAVEINPEDIIKRPATTGNIPQPVAEKSGSMIKEVQGFIRQFKEIKDLLNESGIDLSNLKNVMPGLTGGGDAQAPQPQQNAGNQFLLVQKFLIAAYGDITVNELLDKIKLEYGQRKISSLRFGG